MVIPQKPLSTEDTLSVWAASLKRSSESWSGFLEAFKRYTDERRDQCISSPPQMLQVTQGRAQDCANILKLFEECTKRADEIAARKQK